MIVMKKVWVIFWAYWKWFCTALVTSTVLLLLVATLVDMIRTPPARAPGGASTCIDKGGTWDEEPATCRAPA